MNNEINSISSSSSPEMFLLHNDPLIGGNSYDHYHVKQESFYDQNSMDSIGNNNNHHHHNNNNNNNTQHSRQEMNIDYVNTPSSMEYDFNSYDSYAPEHFSDLDLDSMSYLSESSPFPIDDDIFHNSNMTMTSLSSLSTSHMDRWLTDMISPMDDVVLA
eukprot:Pgem_evm1s13960